MYCCGGKAAERNPDRTAPAAAGFLLSLFDPLSRPLQRLCSRSTSTEAGIRVLRLHTCHLLRWRHRAILLWYALLRPGRNRHRWQEYAATMGYYSLWMPQSIPALPRRLPLAFSVHTASYVPSGQDRFLLRTAAFRRAHRNTVPPHSGVLLWSPPDMFRRLPGSCNPPNGIQTAWRHPAQSY